MGACTSKSGKQRIAHSAKIDLLLDEDYRHSKRECKVLLLGAFASSKGSLECLYMKIVHQQGGFTRDELLEYRPIIYRNVVELAQSVAIYMRKTGIECKELSNKLFMEKILSYNSRLCDGLETNVYFPPDVAKAISHFVTDTVVSKVIEDHMNGPSTFDSPIYFFDNIIRIGAPGYVPTETDILRARSGNGGITETRFNIGQLSIHMIVISNQRSERKKWLHCFESVTAIIFCAGLSDYDRIVVEDPNESRTLMQESLHLFESVVNSRWFMRTSIILFLTKIDLFKAKIGEVPLARYFEEYTGGADVNKAAKYILWKFIQCNRARLSIYPHLNQAQDTTNVRLMFAAVKETILQNALKNSLKDPDIL
ncbi:heterotrimeric G-protein alpha subunit, GPA3-like protein [Macrolepiota fuliginosa MF-IS2]|uniref:Heterotrimeric G-protein alpha subunit, GPA3-like protein n=1 Tax=Macrolepiota fuliginosa MF-IS2 TaxID=1400762 RepID=A0A9P6C097_9AGAR|nr:heterotrimeric G-protein alpha subunit, GPA3-like protein [Macrolepiota fuliginosa MF-IS2]